MMKKAAGRLGVLALALTLISTCLMGGTLAKYTADVTGGATATVAKFAFDLNGATGQTDKKTINLSALFSNTYNDGKVSASSVVVAPGTSGKVAITLQNNGEVALKPTFKIEETNTGKIPLQYAITTTDTEPTSWQKANELAPTMTEVAVGSAAQTFYLHWRWDPDSTDTADTALGVKETLDTAKLDITCTVEQVVPTDTPTA